MLNFNEDNTKVYLAKSDGKESIIDQIDYSKWENVDSIMDFELSLDKLNINYGGSTSDLIKASDLRREIDDAFDTQSNKTFSLKLSDGEWTGLGASQVGSDCYLFSYFGDGDDIPYKITPLAVLEDFRLGDIEMFI